MKIAFISFYSGLASRGGETYVASLAEKLSKDFEVSVFQAGSEKVNRKYHVEKVDVNFDTTHPHSQLPVTHILNRMFVDYFHFQELIFTLKLLPRLWKIKPDIIFPQNSGWEVLVLKIFSIISRSKMIVSGQSGPGWNDKVNLFSHPDIFVALTSSQACWAQKVTVWKNQKIVTVANGVDTEIFCPKGNKLETELTHPTVLVVGAAIRSKRIPDTIRAVAKLTNTSLVVAGTGPNEEIEDSLGRKLLGPKYKRVKIPHQDMPKLYRAVDAFTLCSDSSEAFGIVYLEALASGLPSVATDDPSRREILGDAGIYVINPDDSSEYAEKIKQALAIKSSANQIEQASIFSWDIIADKYNKLICSLLRQK